MLAKFSDFNIPGYVLTNVTLSYKFALKKMPYGQLSLRHLNLLKAAPLRRNCRPVCYARRGCQPVR